MDTLFQPQAIVKARIQAILARTKGIRWDLILLRFAALLGILATLGGVAALLVSVSGLIPGPTGVDIAIAGGIFGSICHTANALGPRITKAAGLCHQAQEGQIPYFVALRQVWEILKQAPEIERQAKAEAEDAEAQRAQAQAEETRAAMREELVGEVLDLIKTKSFKLTENGLVATDLLGGAAASAVGTDSAVVDKAPAEVVQAVSREADEILTEKATDVAGGAVTKVEGALAN